MLVRQIIGLQGLIVENGLLLLGNIELWWNRAHGGAKSTCWHLLVVDCHVQAVVYWALEQGKHAVTIIIDYR